MQSLRARNGKSRVEEAKVAIQFPENACADQDKNNLKERVKTWNSKLGDGFPCVHRRQKYSSQTKELNGASFMTSMRSL